MSLRNVSWTWLTCALLGSVLGGCTSGEENDGPSGPTYAYPTSEAFCQALAEAECNDVVVEACYGSDATSLDADRERCSGVRVTECNPLSLPYHPEFAEDCLDARKRVIDDAELTGDEIAEADAACLPVFSAEGEIGTTCARDTDCDTGGGLRCVVRLGATTGLCQVPVSVSGGGACDAPEAVCTAGTFCSEVAGNYCIEQPGADDACSITAPCASGFQCSAAEAGTCVAQATTGQSCASGSDCASGFCALPSMGTTGVCTAVWRLELTAATCDEYR